MNEYNKKLLLEMLNEHINNSGDSMGVDGEYLSDSAGRILDVFEAALAIGTKPLSIDDHSNSNLTDSSFYTGYVD